MFKPYTVEQLKSIILARLNSIPVVSSGCKGQTTAERLVDDNALEFCIRKVCASHGDCRQALDASRLVFVVKIHFGALPS